MNRCNQLALLLDAALLLPIVSCGSVLNGAEAGGAAAEPTKVTVAARTLPIAPLGPNNPWPHFRFQSEPSPVHTAADLSEEDRAGTFSDATVPLLPYLVQDNYSRQRRSGSLPTIQMENAALRATFYPSLGGRMISLYDKRGRRELLFDNPVLQFANLAIRNAWFSGGVEWNGPLYGHSLLTCSPIFAGTVRTSRGPLLRLYEFDRARETTWQVDVFLPFRDDRLWIHVKAINPGHHDVRFYWWTNLAVPLVPGTRVLAPVDYALSHEESGNARLAFPVFDGFDGSCPLNYPSARSVFFRKPGNRKPWSVCVDGQGHGISHVSTPTLFGRKLFTWGTGRGGKRWMEFLSETGKGDYIEIQGGVTPTQLQDRPLPADASIQWTECISPFAMDPDAAHDANYAAASSAAGKVVDSRVPDAALKEMDGFLTAQSLSPVERLLHRGAGWGWLYEKRTGRRISPGLAFEAVSGEEERPWADLLFVGTFSRETLNKLPCSFNVSDGWMDVLRESARAHGPTWLHELHLGVGELERGAFAKACEHFRSSLALKDNAAAHRCLAAYRSYAGDLEAARADYLRAWSFCGDDPNLAIEIGEFLVRIKDYHAFDAFAKSLPAAVAVHERITLLKAQVALERGEFAMVRRLLQREFATLREGELSLSDLWFASLTKEAEGRAGRKLTPAEKEKLMRDFPPPAEIDFRMR